MGVWAALAVRRRTRVVQKEGGRGQLLGCGCSNGQRIEVLDGGGAFASCAESLWDC